MKMWISSEQGASLIGEARPVGFLWVVVLLRGGGARGDRKRSCREEEGALLASCPDDVSLQLCLAASFDVTGVPSFVRCLCSSPYGDANGEVVSCVRLKADSTRTRARPCFPLLGRRGTSPPYFSSTRIPANPASCAGIG